MKEFIDKTVGQAHVQMGLIAHVATYYLNTHAKLPNEVTFGQNTRMCRLASSKFKRVAHDIYTHQNLI